MVHEDRRQQTQKDARCALGKVKGGQASRSRASHGNNVCIKCAAKCLSGRNMCHERADSADHVDLHQPLFAERDLQRESTARLLTIAPRDRGMEPRFQRAEMNPRGMWSPLFPWRTRASIVRMATRCGIDIPRATLHLTRRS